MVVEYQAGSVGSALSFFTTTPRIIFAVKGSIIPYVLPQVILSSLVGLLAFLLGNPLDDIVEDSSQFLSPLAFLLAFLLVFKTTQAVGSYSTALTMIDEMRTASRVLVRAACAANVLFEQSSPYNEKFDRVKQLTRKVMRLVMLYWALVVEYFQRTGFNATKDPKQQAKLREIVRTVASPAEFDELYKQVDDAPYAEPTIVLFWMKLVCAELVRESQSNDFTLTATNGTLGALDDHFSKLDDIDKHAFPLPYAQLVKILLFFFIFSLPFSLVGSCGALTPVVTAFVAMGFYGLDELAEILDSPFGTDPNDIDLSETMNMLAQDFDILWEGMETSFTDDLLAGEEDASTRLEEALEPYVTGVRKEISSVSLAKTESGQLSRSGSSGRLTKDTSSSSVHKESSKEKKGKNKFTAVAPESTDPKAGDFGETELLEG